MARLKRLDLQQTHRLTAVSYAALAALTSLTTLDLPVQGASVPAAAALQPLLALTNLHVRLPIAAPPAANGFSRCCCTARHWCSVGSCIAPSRMQPHQPVSLLSAKASVVPEVSPFQALSMDRTPRDGTAVAVLAQLTQPTALKWHTWRNVS